MAIPLPIIIKKSKLEQTHVLHLRSGNVRKTRQTSKIVGPKFDGRYCFRSPPVIIPFLRAANNKRLPIFKNLSETNIYFSALIDSGAMVNVMNASVFYKLPIYIKQRTSNICHNLSSVNRQDLDVKRSVYLTIRKDNKNFPTRFIICKNFQYEAIKDTNFFKPTKILLDIANSKFLYQTDKNNNK